MKTHVIQLEGHDDYISLRDKIRWAKSPRVLLVWPNNGKTRLLDLDLKLITRFAEDQGAQLAFVCDYPQIIEKSKQYGIPLFLTIPEAQRRAWRRPKRLKRVTIQSLRNRQTKTFRDATKPEKSNVLNLPLWMRIPVFVAGIFSVLILAALFIPSATINLNLMEQTQSIELNVWSNPEIREINISGAIPAHVLTIQIEQTLEGESSGMDRIPNRAAEGLVTFRNLTDQLIEIPAGLVVRTITTPVIRYQTSKATQLPAGIDSMVDVAVVCLTSGIDGNTPAGSIQAVEGDIGGNLVVFNDEPISGGAELKTFTPTEADYRLVEEKMETLLRETALAEFSRQYPDAYMLPEETLSLSKMIDEERKPETGIPADRFSYRVRAEFSIWMIDKTELEKMAELALSSDFGLDQTAKIGTLKIQSIKAPILDENNTMKWRIHVEQQTIPFIEKQSVLQSITGKTIQQATLIMEKNLKLNEVTIIEIKPKFWTRLPYFPFRMELIWND
jgi:hypothetical protein